MADNVTPNVVEAEGEAPVDRLLAYRILRAAGIAQDAATLAARTMNEHLRLRDAMDATERGTLPTDPRELWMTNSRSQLARFFGGFCVSCANWSPGKDTAGTCTVLPQTLGYKSSAPTDATFGCHGYAEIPAVDDATLTMRTELAMALGLLPAYPED